MADKLDGSVITANSIPGTRIANGAITSTQMQPALWTTIQNATQPKIRSLTYPGDDTAANTGGGQTVIVNGSSFGPNVTIYVNNSAVPSVTVINANAVSFTTSAQAAATYPLYLINTDDGATAILIPGIQYSGTPTWVTTSPLSNQTAVAAWNISLSATGDSPIVYSLQAGSSLPAGISLAANGVISGTMSSPPASDTTYNFTVVATDPQNQDASKAFSVSVSVSVDVQFQYTTLLLHADATNNGNNHAFLDSSTNNFTITRNGNASQGSFSPFSPKGWSNYFDGSGDFLSVADANALDLSTGDFTIEFWVYPLTGVADLSSVIGKRNQSGFTGGDWRISYRSATSKFGIASGTDNTDRSTPAIALNQWSHVAFVRSSGTLYCYANGFLGDSLSWSTVNLDNVETLYIGRNVSGYDFLGYISNVRIVKGSAVYTGTTYTVPTSPLTAISGTSLLTCQSNRLIDNSTNAFTVTKNGDVTVQPFSPYASTTAYSAASHGGSMYLDGSGDYLTVPDSAAFTMGTGDFSVECWYYPTSSARQSIVAQTNAAGTTVAFWMEKNASNQLRLVANVGGTDYAATATATMPLNAWSFLQMVRSGTTIYGYQNGTQVCSVAVGSGALLDSTDVVSVGGGTVSLPVTGYIADVRILKGTAAAATTPTTPLTAIANTSLLLSATNGQIFDSASGAVIETVGDARVNTSIYKYGTGSVYFDGTGDYLSIPYSQNYNFSGGDFTVEGWFYLNSLANSYYVLGGTWTTGTSDEWLIQIQNNGSLRFLTTSDATFYSTGLIKTGTWYHFAASRNANVIKTYINGTAVSMITNANTIGSASKTVYIGQQSGGNWYWNGNVDDFRISKGLGRYPYNFTPPTKAFADKGGTDTTTSDTYFPYTALLLPGNGTNNANNHAFVDSSTNAFTITRNGNASQGTFSPFSQTGWGNYFDGTNSKVTMASVASMSMTGQFTIECWVYWNGTTTLYQNFIGSNDTFTTNASFLRVWGSGVVGAGSVGIGNPTHDSTSSVYAANALPANQWTHVAATRDASNIIRVFINGTLRATGSADTSTYDFGQGGTCIGDSPWDGANGWYSGYISNLRVVKGGALYTSSFTPSTSPLTTTVSAGTVSLLTCQSNRFLDNSSNAYTLTPAGNASVQAFSPFSPSANNSTATNGGSAYFDGSGDYLSLASNSAFAVAGQYTVEFWAYQTAAPTNYASYFLVNVSNGLQIGFNTAGGGVFGVANNLIGWQLTTAAFPLNAWTHIAITRDASNVTRIFYNGVLQTSGTITTSYTQGATVIGFSGPNNGYITGYVSDLRFVNGTAVYTAAFTPPTAPLTAIANTSLLLSCTNAGITDATGKNVLESAGDAKISTTQSKFGGSSMYFDGTGDRLIQAASPNLALGSGDFTIECWLRRSSSSSLQATILQMSSGADSYSLLFGYTSSPNLVIYISSNGSSWDIASGQTLGTVQNDTWVHYALTRYGSTFRAFQNGVQQSTWTSSSSIYQATNQVSIGYAQATHQLAGYINDLRITKGIARYTSNFTPPASANLLK